MCYYTGMRNQLITIPEERIHKRAEARFIQTCGIDPAGSRKHQRMMAQGMKVRDQWLDQVDIKAVVSYYDADAFSGGAARADGAVFDCNYFTRIPEDTVEGVYFYMLTGGECFLGSEDNIADMLFADIWANSYVDSGIEALRADHIIPHMREVFGDRHLILSQEFGPGYFGMDMTKTRDFEKVLDNSSIGVEVRETGLMIPQKSCSGLFLVLNKELKKEPACRRCMGNRSGCEFCEINMRMKEGNRIEIEFLPSGKIYSGERLASVLECAGRTGVDIDGNCGGRGTCGKCKVEIEYPDGEKRKDLACLVPPEDGMKVTVPDTGTVAGRKKKQVILPEGFVPDKGEGYGVAVDIGTTTVVVMIWDLSKGQLVDVDAFTNPQGAHGADVISRIQYTMENEDGLTRLHRAIIDGIAESVEEVALGKFDISEINRYMVAGNTTMSHLFLGIDPRSLAVSPFDPAFTGPVERKAAELGLPGGSDAVVKVIPNIAGHVGSDITAGIVATDIPEMKKNHLFIDIGTNGEIVFAGGGKIYACSTAAGPAFEGMSITDGMRAAQGAVERVDITEDSVIIGTIGDEKPVGICGSGIIDCVGEMVRTGIIDKTGRILSQEKLEEKGLNANIAARVVKKDGKAIFVLYSDGDLSIGINQKDVREVQLAKAAIEAGWQVLTGCAGVEIEDIEEVSIAGAFGSYIRKTSAVDCRLIPDIPRDRMDSVGNTAGVGCSMALLSRDAFDQMVRLSEEIEHIELATRTDFQDVYTRSMRF